MIVAPRLIGVLHSRCRHRYVSYIAQKLMFPIFSKKSLTFVVDYKCRNPNHLIDNINF